jgi:tetratricopeptide (TPR) repeat protein
MNMRILLFSIVLSSLVACLPPATEEQNQASQNQAAPAEPVDVENMREQGKAHMAALDKLVAARDFEGAAVKAEEAIYALGTVITRDANYRPALAPQLARAYYYARKFAEAKQWFQESTEADPGNPEYHKMLALTHFNLGNIPEGQQSIVDAIRYQDTQEMRDEIAEEMAHIGQTSFEYGTKYIEDGYPKKGTDYQQYGLAMYRLAFDLEGQTRKDFVRQIVTWGKFLKDSAVVSTYQQYL